jgi:hypothetical protein
MYPIQTVVKGMKYIEIEIEGATQAEMSITHLFQVGMLDPCFIF